MATSVFFGCRDVARFSTKDDHFEGAVVRGDFVRAGIATDARLCLSLDAEHLQDRPGEISTSDGRFARAPLRPIPQIWHDPLSTLSFGDGRAKNLVYVATPTSDAGEGEVLVVVSLMQEGDVEVRFVRGAPGGAVPGSEVFGVFALERTPGVCPF